MVFDPTADDLAGVHRDLWEYRPIADRRSAATVVLYVGQRAMVLFFELSDFNFEHLVANAHLFGKVYFPRLVMPLSTVVSNLITFGIQFSFF